MPGHYTPTAAAALVGISTSTLRNYCTAFKVFLSPEASPAPGHERKLSDLDIAILQRVKELRAQGMDTAGIVDTLQTEDASTLQPYVDSVTTPQATVTPPEPPQQPPAPTQAIELYGAILGHTAALQARMDALQAQQDSQAKAATGRVTLFAVGVLVGLAVALIVVGVIWLGR